MNNRIQLLENRERNALERIEELETRMLEKDEQIANIKKAYQHIMDRIATVPFEGEIIGFKVRNEQNI